MDAKSLIKANRLSEARSRLIEDVKASPSDSKCRTVLFQVLSFFGEWDKAESHLDILAMCDTRAETGVRVYKNLMAAERERAEVCNGERRPSFISSPPSCLEQQFAAWDELRKGRAGEACNLYEKTAATIPEISGTLAGREFRGFRDVDAFLSHFLEVFIHDRYYWAPFHRLSRLSILAPKTLLDLLWTPATITTWEGLSACCFLPVTYPGSSSHGDDMVRLGKMTAWRDLGGGCCEGSGQHVFMIGAEERAILEIGDVQFFKPPAGET